jgi:radical SAM family uncharacterized protein
MAELTRVWFEVPFLNQERLSERLERILPTVEKPGRYVGGELNQVNKPWESVQTHVALVFPDIYDLGQSNLGIALLYDLLNQQSDIVAERAFSPWVDMEAVLRDASIPLFSLESKRPLLDFDIIGVSLPYETLYTNFLNILDLSGIPLYSKDRSADHPLVLAGGQAVFNPEAVADFVDAFVIGEGEEAILEVVAAHQVWKESGGSRQELLVRLTDIPGVYVPALVKVDYFHDGRIRAVQPIYEDVKLPVVKRILAKLPPPLSRFLVPNVEVVHERVSIEIMRGCTRGCRFCHAGMVNRPIRERPIEEVLSAIKSGLDQTGYEEVGLLSLSSSDHSDIVPLIGGLQALLKERQVDIALPSLRIESFSDDLMDVLQTLSPGGGFTLAPEAGTERLRKVINKPLSDADLMQTIRSVFQHGWKSLKLYFMIGHPQETMEDVAAIANISKAILQEGRQIAGGRVKVHVGVSTFIPKPHTPFQWSPFADPESIEAKLSLLRDAFRGTKIKMTWNDPQVSLLEAWLSRGDRRLAKVIEQAWRKGARFDAWGDQFQITPWLEAFAECGLDPDFFSFRERALDEVLPWDHINAGVRKSFLLEDYRLSMAGKVRPDCREHCYACGILASFNDLRLAEPGGGWKCP